MADKTQEQTENNSEVLAEEPAQSEQPIAAIPVFPPKIDFKLNVQDHAGAFDPNNVKFLVYGDSGAGKTVFASSWPKPIFLDVDKGMASVRRQVHRIEISTWNELQEAYLYLAYGEHDFRTIVLDSLNEIQYLAMQNVVTAYPTIRRSYDNLPSQSDYGKMLDDFDKMVRHMRGLKLNIVFIAQVKEREYETDPIQPQFIGKATGRNISRMMDEIGYLYKLESSEAHKPRAMVFDEANFITKDRSDVLPARIENPTHEKLLHYWLGDK